jgi:Arc/MetJ-type ribon-helix-helix transcriptional regulator
MDKGQREKKKERFMMIAGMIGACAGKASVGGKQERTCVEMSGEEAAQLDLLIEQDFYSSREEFLETAVRNLLQTHVPEAQPETSSRVMVLGVIMHTRHTLEKLRAMGKRLELRVTGVLRLTEDITPELAREVIQSIKVTGVFLASSAVKAALADRTAG